MAVHGRVPSASGQRAATRLPWCASRGAGRKSAPSPWGPQSPRSRLPRAAGRRGLRRPRPRPRRPPGLRRLSPEPVRKQRTGRREGLDSSSGGRNHHRPTVYLRSFYKWRDTFTRTAFETQQISYRVGRTAAVQLARLWLGEPKCLVRPAGAVTREPPPCTQDSGRGAARGAQHSPRVESGVVGSCESGWQALQRRGPKTGPRTGADHSPPPVRSKAADARSRSGTTLWGSHARMGPRAGRPVLGTPSSSQCTRSGVEGGAFLDVDSVLCCSALPPQNDLPSLSIISRYFSRRPVSSPITLLLSLAVR